MTTPSDDLWRAIADLRSQLEGLQTTEYTKYRGTKGSDFTTTDLPQHGDYGFQTADAEIQVNCNGTIRAVTTAAL